MQKVLALCIAALGLALTSASAQHTGTVGGMVFDSVSRAPLPGAIVQMIPPDGTTLFSAITDARGRYSITGAPPGRYVIGFQHYRLDSLALEPPLRAVEARAGENAKVDLAIPAPSTIVTHACRTTPADSLGLFFGVLRDVRTGNGLDSGRVTVRWSEIVIDSSGLTTHERVMSAPTSTDGWFGMCRVPAGTDVLVRAFHRADSTGFTLVTVPAHGLKRFDLGVGGVASLRGRVGSEGRPVPNARVRAAGDERGVYTDSAGGFRLAPVAAGTQTVEVRALGYAPEARVVTLFPDSETVMDVELTTVKRVMDTIKVVGQRVYSIDAMGFERRRRTAGGTFFDEETVRRRSPFSVLQLLYSEPSIRVVGSGLERTVVISGAHAASAFSSERCLPAFFLNGVGMPGDLLTDLDLFVRPDELQGIEVYSRMVPAEFRVEGTCGAVVVWTRRSPTRKR